MLKNLARTTLDRVGLHLIRHHYESPLVYASDLRSPLSDEREIAGLDMNEAGQLGLLSQFTYHDELLTIPGEKPSATAYGYGNPYFCAGDAEYLYSMIRRFKPQRILEIGSGESTLLAQLAIAANRRDDTRYACEQICVEPFGAPWLEQTGAVVIRSRIERVDPAIVDRLTAGDILFIDSSHVIRPQGDVLHECLSLIGRVRPGVLVHVHDVFTPRDYPTQWIVAERRLYNEQYLLEAFLCFNSAFKIVGAVNWLWHNHRAALSRACPILAAVGGEPGSFWMMRAAA